VKAQAEAVVASILRTFVPSLVGGLLTWITSLGIHVDPQLEGLVTVLLFGFFTALYYAAVRFVEEKLPWVGILLGYAKSPDSYSKGQVEPGELPKETALNLTVINPATPEALGDVLQQAKDRIKNGPDHRLE